MTSFVQYLIWYVLQAIVLLGIGICGAFIGIKLRKMKNTKQAKDETVE